MPRVKPSYLTIDGFRLPETFTRDAFLSATNYQPRPGDLFIATFPKCGTTWMSQIVLLILRRGEIITNKYTYFSLCPFFELTGAESVENMVRPGCIKTHLPVDRLKFSKDAKYIYVARHPRDCLVSFYHHCKFFPIYRFTDGTLDDFFELFIRGENDFNDYFDNLLSWYEHRNDPNVFFTTFEDMKRDHRGTVLKVAEFLGKDYRADLENNEELLNRIIKYSSLEYMKTDVNDIFTDAFLNPDKDAGLLYKCNQEAKRDGHFSVGKFIRSGNVGEGKEMLSDEQLERLDARILEKTHGSDVMSLWS